MNGFLVRNPSEAFIRKLLKKTDGIWFDTWKNVPLVRIGRVDPHNYDGIGHSGEYSPTAPVFNEAEVTDEMIDAALKNVPLSTLAPVRASTPWHGWIAMCDQCYYVGGGIFKKDRRKAGVFNSRQALRDIFSGVKGVKIVKVNLSLD